MLDDADLLEFSRKGRTIMPSAQLSWDSIMSACSTGISTLNDLWLDSLEVKLVILPGITSIAFMWFTRFLTEHDLLKLPTNMSLYVVGGLLALVGGEVSVGKPEGR